SGLFVVHARGARTTNPKTSPGRAGGGPSAVGGPAVWVGSPTLGEFGSEGPERFRLSACELDRMGPPPALSIEKSGRRRFFPSGHELERRQEGSSRLARWSGHSQSR